LHTGTKLLQRHFRTIAKAHSIVMWTVFQPSESNVFVSRHEEGSLNLLGNAFKPEFSVTRHAHGSRRIAGSDETDAQLAGS